jgi:hypothetical protein
MINQTTGIAVTTFNLQSIAVEITPNMPISEQSESDVELIDTGTTLSERVGDLTALIHKTATGLVDSIGSLPDAARPKKVAAEFSMSFSAEAGFWYVAKGSATGAIKVVLEWQFP